MNSVVKPNKIERLKAELKPADFLPKIDQLNLNELTEEERFYLKNYGIYNHKLSPETFMLRLRITAGRIAVSQLREIATIAREYQLKPLITMRAQIELHGMDAGNVLTIWHRLERSGITTWQTLTDNFRTIVTDPLDGESSTSLLETYPLIRKMESLFLKNPDYLGTLPRKFNTAICGNSESSHSFFSNDLYFALAQKGETVGFNLYLGGKNSEMAQSVDIFVTEGDLPTLFKAAIKAYKHYGLRGTRSKTRLYHLLQSVGMETFRSYIQSFYPMPLQSAGKLLGKKVKALEWTTLRNGRKAFCFRSRFGEISADDLSCICDYAEEEKLSIRLGIDQNIHLLGFKTPSTPLKKYPHLSRLSVCAGSRYCSLSLFDMKEEAEMLPLDRLSRLDVSLGYSGCLKGCGKHMHTDIGLIGLRTAVYGPTQKSVRLFLGGQYSDGQAASRLILMAVPLHSVRDMIDVILDEFEQSPYDDFEIFSRNILNRFSTDFLALWFLAKYYSGKAVSLKRIRSGPDTLHSTEEERHIIEHAFSELTLWTREEPPFHKGIQYLSQKLWRE